MLESNSGIYSKIIAGVLVLIIGVTAAFFLSNEKPNSLDCSRFPKNYDEENIKIIASQSAMLAEASGSMIIHGNGTVHSCFGYDRKLAKGKISQDKVNKILNQVESSGLLCMKDRYTSSSSLTESVTKKLKVEIGGLKKKIVNHEETGVKTGVPKSFHILHSKILNIRENLTETNRTCQPASLG